jgi:hypothetical protein
MADIDFRVSTRLGLALAAVLLAGAAVASSPAHAATAMADPLYGDPAHPNLAGMWNPEFVFLGPPPGGAGGGPPGAPPGALPPGGPPPAPPGPQLTPAYAAKLAAWQKKFETGEQEPDTVTRCLAFGMPRFGTMPVEIIQTPGQLTLNLGVLHDIRRIYMDGIGHTAGADPSFSGDSVGHWEGDTLVVETNNLRPGTLDRGGVPYSDKLTAVERIRRTGPDRLEIDTVLTDPEAFTAPFAMHRVYIRMAPGSRFEEYLCENNKDV